MTVTIYHNPACGTSRNALELIRHVGIEPHVIEYLKSPPSRVMIAWLAERTAPCNSGRYVLSGPCVLRHRNLHSD